MAEKLLLWQHGVDDILLKCFKMVYVREHIADLVSAGPFEIFLAERLNSTLEFVVAGFYTMRPLVEFSVQFGYVLQVQGVLNDFQRNFP